MNILTEDWIYRKITSPIEIPYEMRFYSSILESRDSKIVALISERTFGEESEKVTRLITAVPDMYRLLKKIHENAGIQCDINYDNGKEVSRFYRAYLDLALYNKIQSLFDFIDGEN